MMLRSLATLLLVLPGPSWAARPAAKAEPKPAEVKAAAPAKAAPVALPTWPAKPSAKAASQPGALAPLHSSVKTGWTHGPFAEGGCSLCHEKDDPKNPGKVPTRNNELCYQCHEDVRELMAQGVSKHRPAEQSCIECHNPHNARERKLLVDEASALCYSCHEPIKKLMDGAKVKHGAVTDGEKCTVCHNPHAANVEKLLVALPFDLCVNCHSKDGMVDDKGVKLTNFKKLLDENPVWHAPVASKDCSACHNPHGSAYFRLLTNDYPAKFYSPYDPKVYALCYDCHNDQVVADPETTTLTQFRDGKRNLHYLHVNKPDHGRTCRACHDVHASKQPHHIRDGVPYGPKGWMLKINFVATPKGGSCEKTCHTKYAYDSGTKVEGKKP